jgi:hypothetical protein
MATMTVALTPNQAKVLDVIKTCFDGSLEGHTPMRIVTAKSIAKVLTDIDVKQLHDIIGELHQLRLVVCTNDTANLPKKQIIGVCR